MFNKAIRVLLTTNGLILFAAAMLAPIYALYVERIGGDLLDASLLGAAFALSAGIVTLISGRYSDKVKENEYVVMFGYSLMGIAFLGYLFAGNIYHLLIIQIILGLGEAIYSPAFDSLYSKHLDMNEAGFEWGAWESMNYFVQAIAAAVGGLVVVTYGFYPMFIAMAVLCFVSSIYMYFLPRKIL